MALIVGANRRHYGTHGDEKPRCPHCSMNNVVKIGQLHVDGASQDAFKCNSCSSLFSSVDGGIRSMIDEAKDLSGGKEVGFTAVVNGSQVDYSSSMPIDNGYKIDETNNKLNNINSSIYSMQTSIRDLCQTVERLAHQNVELMNKLATDPLNGIRKSITDFNLE